MFMFSRQLLSPRLRQRAHMRFVFRPKRKTLRITPSLTNICGALFCLASSTDPEYKVRYFDEHVKQFARATLEPQLMDRPAAIAGNETPVEEILEEKSPKKASRRATQQLDGFFFCLLLF